jgi:hypothetical protein
MYQLFVLKCSTQCNSILTKEMTEIYQLTFSSCCGSCNKQPYIGLAATRAAFTGAAATGAAAMGPAVTKAAFTGAAATGAAVQEAAPPAKRQQSACVHPEQVHGTQLCQKGETAALHWNKKKINFRP